MQVFCPVSSIKTLQEFTQTTAVAIALLIRRACAACNKKGLLFGTSMKGQVGLEQVGQSGLQAHRRANFPTHGSRKSGVPPVLFQVVSISMACRQCLVSLCISAFRDRQSTKGCRIPSSCLLRQKSNVGIFLACRWVNCLLLREVPFLLSLRLWDTYLAEGPRMKEFLKYLLAAFLLYWSSQLSSMDFQVIPFCSQNAVHSLKSLDLTVGIKLREVGISCEYEGLVL